MKGKNEMMRDKDFRDIILSQKEGKGTTLWKGNVLGYLYKIKENPEIATFAPGRIYNMIMKYGTEEIDESRKIMGYEDLVFYKFFKDKIFGTLEPIHDIMRFLKASARRTETGKRILIMVGPVSSGKSTIAALIKRGLEADDTPKYAIKGCPLNEEPLHVIPESDRPYWNEELKLNIEGILCPVCQLNIDQNHTNDDGTVNWEDIEVEQIKFSEQRRKGIGTFQPSDPKSQDIGELIGRVNVSKMSRFGESDPRAYQFDGELQVANGGMIEYIEILKADVKFHYVLITAAQEQMIKSPGFPQIYIDTLILSHTNQTEFDTFKSDRKNEALHDRMYPIMVPCNVRVDDEIKIYQKMINESDFRDVHIAPHTLRLAAQFAILTRLTDSKKVTSLMEKMKLYNGEVSEEFKKTDIDVKSLLQEGKRNGEGMSGISPRFIINALNVALGTKEDKNCINPIDIIRSLRNNFDHSMGISEEDKERFLTMLTGDKNSVAADYKEVAKKEVNMAFIHAYEEQAQTLFERYMTNITAFCKKEKILDSVTGEYSSPDEKIMRSIEDLIGVPVNSKKEFRNGVFVYKTDILEMGRVFSYRDYDPLREAIEKKLMSDLKNVVSLSLADSASTDPRGVKRREKAFELLMEKGYCDKCAGVLLKFISEVLRKES
jgi:serine protein kinase